MANWQQIGRQYFQDYTQYFTVDNPDTVWQKIYPKDIKKNQKKKAVAVAVGLFKQIVDTENAAKKYAIHPQEEYPLMALATRAWTMKKIAKHLPQDAIAKFKKLEIDRDADQQQPQVVVPVVVVAPPPPVVVPVVVAPPQPQVSNNNNQVSNNNNVEENNKDILETEQQQNQQQVPSKPLSNGNFYPEIIERNPINIEKDEIRKEYNDVNGNSQQEHLADREGFEPNIVELNPVNIEKDEVHEGQVESRVGEQQDNGNSSFPYEALFNIAGLVTGVLLASTLVNAQKKNDIHKEQTSGEKPIQELGEQLIEEEINHTITVNDQPQVPQPQILQPPVLQPRQQKTVPHELRKLQKADYRTKKDGSALVGNTGPLQSRKYDVTFNGDRSVILPPKDGGVIRKNIND